MSLVKNSIVCIAIGYFSSPLGANALTSDAPASQNHLDFKSRAAEQIKKGNHEAAIEGLTEAIKLAPSDSEALNLRAREYLSIFERKKAIADSTAALKLRETAKYYLTRGDAFAALSDNEYALADYDKALELAPNNAYGYSKRGLIFVSMKRYQKAIDDYNHSLSLDPQNRDVYFYRAGVWKALKDESKAIADINEAMKLAPKNIYYLNFRGDCFLRLGRFDEAIADFDKIIEIAPQYFSGYESKMSAYEQRKEFEAALKVADQYVANAKVPGMSLNKRS